MESHRTRTPCAISSADRTPPRAFETCSAASKHSFDCSMRPRYLAIIPAPLRPNSATNDTALSQSWYISVAVAAAPAVECSEPGPSWRRSSSFVSSRFLVSAIEMAMFMRSRTFPQRSRPLNRPESSKVDPLNRLKSRSRVALSIWLAVSLSLDRVSVAVCTVSSRRTFSARNSGSRPATCSSVTSPTLSLAWSA